MKTIQTKQNAQTAAGWSAINRKRPALWQWRLCVGMTLCLLVATAAAQSPAPVGVGGEILPLSLKQAVQIALAPDGNTRLQLATESVARAKALSAQARSGLLPNLAGSVTDQNKTTNLAAMGIKLQLPIPGLSFPEMVGPFSTFDVRASATQTLFDFSTIRRYQSARAGVGSAVREKDGAADQATSLVAKAYLAAQRSAEAVKAVKADIALAESFLKLAQDQKAAGSGTSLDVTRAAVQLGSERQRLLQADNDHREALLNLLKVIGLKLSTSLELIDPLTRPATLETPPSPESALQKALATRADYQAQLQREQSARLNYSSVKWERLPSLVGFGDYGSIGNTTDHLIPTRTVGVALRIPIFDGGRVDARRGESAAASRQEQIKTRDMRDQVELEIRTALDRLRSSQLQLEVAEQNLGLAKDELAQAERRYRAGVSSSLELTDAQSRLERARDNDILALFLYQSARIDLAQSTGTIQSWAQ